VEEWKSRRVEAQKYKKSGVERVESHFPPLYPNIITPFSKWGIIMAYSGVEVEGVEDSTP
jgi:hypothetical protein